MSRDLLKEYFAFTKKERIGIYTLLIIIIICLIIPFCFPLFIKHTDEDHHRFDKEISILKIKENTPSDDRTFKTKPSNRDQFNSNYFRKPVVIRNLFFFDPNLIGTKEWEALGVKDKTIATIEKYIAKGGHFYKPEDIAKIWGLSLENIKVLLPFVRIKDQNVRRSFYINDSKSSHVYKPFHRYEQQPFDLNNADSAALDSLPGIGPKLAKRILIFRDRLGGFNSVDQVKETYGLPDSTFLRIKTKLFVTKELKRININTCTLEQLKGHPYIKYALANPILQYRTQHGTFNDLQDLKKIMVITDSVYKRILPYLSVK